MADHMTLNPGADGAVVATDEIGGVHYQRVKVGHGADGAFNDVSAGSPLPVSITGSPTIDSITDPVVVSSVTNPVTVASVTNPVTASVSGSVTVASVTNPIKLNQDATVNLPFSRLLDLDGDGTGTVNANGNYSGGSDEFFVQPAPSVVYKINRLTIVVEDATGGNEAEYGNLGAALTNGIQISTANGSGPIAQLVASQLIKTNADLARYSDAFEIIQMGTPTNDIIKATIDFVKMFGAPLRLEGTASERLRVIVNDDFSGLVGHYFLVSGYQEGTAT